MRDCSRALRGDIAKLRWRSRRNHPAAWQVVNGIEGSFFERRYVGDRAGAGLVARIMLEHDDVVCWPAAAFVEGTYEVGSIRAC